MLLYTTLIAMSSADPETARNFETKQYAHNQGPATANTYDPYYHNLASDSVVWAHPVFRPASDTTRGSSWPVVEQLLGGAAECECAGRRHSGASAPPLRRPVPS